MAAFDPQARIETLERALHWAQLTIQKKESEIQQLLERLQEDFGRPRLRRARDGWNIVLF